VTRPLYWSVRRELWENRSIHVAPLAAAAVLLFGFLISTVTLPSRMRALASLDPAKQRSAIAMPYNMIAGILIITAFLVGAFYCLDALHGERRDRSILFWKSLPVSDFTTVLAKALVPVAVLPVLVLAIVVSTHVVFLLVSTAVLLASGNGAGRLWADLPFVQTWVAFAYALVAIALWHAPIYAWLLLVSGWARRATFLWAVMPAAAIAMFERITFRTSHFAHFLQYRLAGWFQLAFSAVPPGTAPGEPLSRLTPVAFLFSPGLWIGLAVAAAFLGAAVRLRRYREPI
jgi:ABC-2 type transport system permease protein